ncbi:MAG: 16S rRNA (cytidine(1402)-2'-O)-methyltransferase [Lentisphaerae bacterium]|nr:16S rRNA (cytidine(1402)-2'-O)-methyltransferase [Lentisphaerota bacterium]
MKPGVYMVGTPIGNLQDISSRALDTLRAANYVMAEDTRHTGRLLAHFGIQARLVSCHRFNEKSRTHFVVQQVCAGKTVALVTSAGMPAVSDPGARVALACRQAGAPVFVVPGPSSVTAALALSGFGGGGYVMQGFLPRKPGARRRQLEAALALEMPVVVFESPYRLLKLLEDLEALAPARLVCAARELTKLNERKHGQHFYRGVGGAFRAIAQAGRPGVSGES